METMAPRLLVTRIRHCGDVGNSTNEKENYVRYLLLLLLGFTLAVMFHFLGDLGEGKEDFIFYI